MRHWSTLLALLAAIVMIAAGGGAAQAAACDPCPPDCPMMAAMTTAPAAADNAKGEPRGEQPDNPCQPDVLCQAPMAVAALWQSATPDLSHRSASHGSFEVLPAPSQPPDPALRPPIQL